MIIPPAGYLKAMRELCDEYGILYISDEIITGFGRTGKMFGGDNWSIVPDIMTVAKGITSGYIQLGATILSDRIHKELIELSSGTLFHGFTYSGHPTACMVALKNIEIMETEGLIKNSLEVGKILANGLKFLEEKHWIVSGIRSMGLLGAFELYQNPYTKKRFDLEIEISKKVVAECLKRKLIVRSITYKGTDTIAIAPPLIITEEEMEKIMSIFSDAIGAVEAKLEK